MVSVFMALAALLDKSYEHGPIETLFTVDEETGLTGAKNLGKDMITGNILINLDSEDEAQIFLGCAGGIDTLGHFDYTDAPAPAGYQFFKFSILKFKGGHSGADIHLGRANANKQLARFLFSLYRAYDGQVAVADINGGEPTQRYPRQRLCRYRCACRQERRPPQARERVCCCT